MREFPKRIGRWLSVGWFWPLVLLALPNCVLGNSGLPNPNNFNPGSGDLSTGVMCDIPAYPPDGVFECADPAELPTLLAQAQVQDHAALAFNFGEAQTNLTLDFSQAAIDQCGPGIPRKVQMIDQFPRGTPVCLNCLQMMPVPYQDPKAVCEAKCKEAVGVGGPQPADLDAYCKANARVSTNAPVDHCQAGVCTFGGSPQAFVDLRKDPEPLTWTEFDKTTTTANGGTLTFNGPGSTVNFDGGGASEQLITKGDAWVEFGAGQPDVTHVLALRESCKDLTVLCPDQDDSLGDISIGLSLNVNGEVNVVDNQGKVAGPFPNYVAGTERFRIHIADRHDGKADISFSRGSESCVSGSACNDTPLAGVPPISLSYPLRVDATFREAPASLVDVKIMRIIEPK